MTDLVIRQGLLLSCEHSVAGWHLSCRGQMAARQQVREEDAMNTRSRFVIFAVTVVAGIAFGAGRASAGSIPFDATGSGVDALAAPTVLAAPPFLLGEVD